MAFKFVALSCLLAVASAVSISTPAATSFSSISHGTHHVSQAAPVAYHAAPAAYHAAPAATSFSSVSHGTQHLSHAAPVTYQAAPVAYHSAPVAYQAAPVAYHSAPVAYHNAPLLKKAIIAEEHYAPAQYDFAYSVHDPHTGDIKEQKESRQGDAVHGMYSLIEADGTKRIVEYTADEHSGFNAVVHREPSKHPVAVKAIAAPVYKSLAAPVYQHAAPVAHYSSSLIKAAPLAQAHYSTAPAVSYAHLSTPNHVIHH